MEKQGVRVEQIASTHATTDRIDLPTVLRRLGALEITSLLVEGGSHLNTAVLNGGLADKVILYMAPKLFGESAVPFTAALDQPLTLSNPRFHQLREDFAVEAYLRDPYGS